MSILPTIRKVVPLVLLLAIVAPISAQDDSQNPHPLLELLAYVPDTEATGDLVYYADIQSSAETAIGEPQDSVQQAWETLGYPDDLWVGWIPSVLPPFKNFLLMMLDDGGQSTGFDVRTVERTLYFGEPPSDAMILQGNFDSDAIVAAYTEQTHELQSRDDVTLLCSTNGCEDGQEIYVEERNQLNPFGGNFGRREPIVLMDNLILNSPDIAVVESMLEASSGETMSLTDSPNYQAAVIVATQQGILRQAVMVDSDNPAFWDIDAVIWPFIEAEKREALQEKVSPLPPYDLIMMADTASVDTQTQAGLVLLVYSSENDADLAVEALQANLAPDGLPSMNTGQPLHTILTERGEMQFEVVAEPSTGRYIVVLSLRAPLVQIPQPDHDTPTFADMQFRVFLTMLNQRDILWLIYNKAVE